MGVERRRVAEGPAALPLADGVLLAWLAAGDEELSDEPLSACAVPDPPASAAPTPRLNNPALSQTYGLPQSLRFPPTQVLAGRSTMCPN